MDTILIVDDDINTRETLSDILTRRGFAVFIAGSGAGALDLIRKEKIDLVILDIYLPDMSGMDILNDIKTDHHNIAVIIITGAATLDTAIDAVNSGAFSYIEKPLNLNQIFQHIVHAIEKQKTDIQLKRNIVLLTTINTILKIAIEQSSLQELMERILKVIISIPWLTLEPVGCVRLVNGEIGALDLIASIGLEDAMDAACMAIPFGKCYCGAVILNRDIMFVESISDECVMSRLKREGNGLYIVPIVSGEEGIGTMSFLTKHGHKGGIEEKEFLSSISRTLAGILERKKIEDELEEKTAALSRLNTDLEARVREEIEKQQEQKQILIHQARLAEMGEMLAVIAHQWRQPLNALGLIIQDMEEAFEFGEFNKEYLGKSVSDAMEQINAMSSTIDSFRNFYKTSRFKTTFDLRNVVENALRIAVSFLKHHEITLDTEIDNDNPLYIVGYENEFMQATLNLINNAKDAIIGLQRRDGRITVKVTNKDGLIVIGILDNGGGVADINKGKIFLPYFSTKKEKTGTGIGLYMSKVIIEQHMNGIIYFENTGDGARFTMEIPVADDSSIAASTII